MNVSLQNPSGAPISEAGFFRVRAPYDEGDRETGASTGSEPGTAELQAGNRGTARQADTTRKTANADNSSENVESEAEEGGSSTDRAEDERVGGQTGFGGRSNEALPLTRHSGVNRVRSRRAGAKNLDRNANDSASSGPTWNVLFAAAVANDALEHPESGGLGLGTGLVRRGGAAIPAPVPNVSSAGGLSPVVLDSVPLEVSRGTGNPVAANFTPVETFPTGSLQASPSSLVELLHGVGNNVNLGQLVSSPPHLAGPAPPMDRVGQATSIKDSVAEIRSSLGTAQKVDGTAEGRVSSNADGLGIGISGLREWMVMAQPGIVKGTTGQRETSVAHGSAKVGADEVGTGAGQKESTRETDILRLSLSGFAASPTRAIPVSPDQGKKSGGESRGGAAVIGTNGHGVEQQQTPEKGDPPIDNSAKGAAGRVSGQMGTPGAAADDLSFAARLTRKPSTETTADKVELAHAEDASKTIRHMQAEGKKPEVPLKIVETAASTQAAASEPAKSAREPGKIESDHSARVTAGQLTTPAASARARDFSGGNSAKDGEQTFGFTDGENEETGTRLKEVRGKERGQVAAGKLVAAKEEIFPSQGEGDRSQKAGSSNAEGGGSRARLDTPSPVGAGSRGEVSPTGLTAVPAGTSISSPRTANPTNSSDRRADTAAPTTGLSETGQFGKPGIAQPVKQVALAMSAGDQQNVEVRLMDRAGRIHVAVRTADPVLSSTLRGDLGDLVSRLEGRGFQADVWTPGASQTGSGGQAGSSDPQRSPWDGSGNGGQSRSQHQDRSQQDRQQEQDRAAAWLAQVQHAERWTGEMGSDEPLLTEKV